MSKAFTRETEADNDFAEEEASNSLSSLPPLPAGSKNYITPDGHQRLLDEFQWLMNKERPQVTATVAWAAANGDRSENADYIYGKKRLREIDRRIRFLTRRLDIAEVVTRQPGEMMRSVFFSVQRSRLRTEKVKRKQFPSSAWTRSTLLAVISAGFRPWRERLLRREKAMS